MAVAVTVNCDRNCDRDRERSHAPDACHMTHTYASIHVYAQQYTHQYNGMRFLAFRGVPTTFKFESIFKGAKQKKTLQPPHKNDQKVLSFLRPILTACLMQRTALFTSKTSPPSCTQAVASICLRVGLRAMPHEHHMLANTSIYIREQTGTCTHAEKPKQCAKCHVMACRVWSCTYVKCVSVCTRHARKPCRGRSTHSKSHKFGAKHAIPTITVTVTVTGYLLPIYYTMTMTVTVTVMNSSAPMCLCFALNP